MGNFSVIILISCSLHIDDCRNHQKSRYTESHSAIANLTVNII